MVGAECTTIGTRICIAHEVVLPNFDASAEVALWPSLPNLAPFRSGVLNITTVDITKPKHIPSRKVGAESGNVAATTTATVVLPIAAAVVVALIALRISVATRGLLRSMSLNIKTAEPDGAARPAARRVVGTA
jgi:hypothetical protein